MKNERPLLVQPYMLTQPAELKNYVDIERGLNLWPPFVATMLVLQIVTFVWSGYTYTMNPNDNLLIEGQFQGYWVSSLQGWMRVVSSTFLHAGLAHIFGNMALFYIAGVMLEHLYGTLRIAQAYGTALLAQALASYMFYDDKTSTVGASGAVFGMIGFLIMFYALYRREIFIRHRTVGILFAVLTLQSIALGFTSKMVNNAAHVGGLIAGLICGYVFAPYFVESRERPSNKLASRAVVAACIVLALGPFAIMHRNLSSHANIRFLDKLDNLIAFLFQPTGVTHYEVSYWRTLQERTRDEAPQEPAKKNETEEEKRQNAQTLNEAHSAGVREQGEMCPRCDKNSATPCVCKPGCRWTYFHHFEDSECRIKIKTTVWGPNTGSPFKMGFDAFPCHEALGRYYRWEEARNDCYAP